MTPGFAKPRNELPWLPYGACDRVIINAHNFTPAATFNVNGKVPVSVWCPSRDDVGNGTTTLYDLVGTKNGTLTNMDAATDWVADTSAGGVRALDFDAVNDRVDLGTGLHELSGSAKMSLAFWAKRSTASNSIVLANVGANFLTIALWIDGNVYFQCSPVTPGYADSGTNWTHWGMSLAGGILKGYRNGVEVVSVSGPTVVPTLTQSTWIGWYQSVNQYSSGRVDDIRAFADDIGSAGFVYLYGGGNGRGRVS